MFSLPFVTGIGVALFRVAAGTGVELFLGGGGTGVMLLLGAVEAGGEIFFATSGTGTALFFAGISTTGVVFFPVLRGVDPLCVAVIIGRPIGVMLRPRFDAVRGGGIGVSRLGGKTSEQVSK